MKLATEPYFLGRWQMVRLIESPTGGAVGEFWGEAVFERVDALALPDRLRSETAIRAGEEQLDGIRVTSSATGAAELGAHQPASGELPPCAPDAWPNWLRCTEKGVLRYEGHDYAAGRVTYWRIGCDGWVDVVYDDGRPFHGFAPDQPDAVHLCGADHYAVSYRFDADDWSSRWRVTGPSKDYWMTTRYNRLSGD